MTGYNISTIVLQLRLGARVRTDLGTDSQPHLVHCRSNRCRSVFVDSDTGTTIPVISVGGVSPSMLAYHYQRGWWLWSVSICTGDGAVSDGTTAGLHYQLISTIWCTKSWHVSLPFFTTWPRTDSAGPGNVKLLNRSGLFFVDWSDSAWNAVIWCYVCIGTYLLLKSVLCLWDK